MKLTSLLVGAALAATSITSYAAGDSQAINVPLSGNPTIGYSTNFGATHLVAGTFTDVFTFSPSVGASLVDVYIQTMNLFGTHDIDFISADLNGNVLSFSPVGASENGWLNPSLVSGPLVLTVSGISKSITASYSGTLNANPVPEPETYIMMLGGLGILSYLGRRRRKS
ncbi:FxDxF family PEP-CTERM protein [Duganella sp. S19_KUP01_CR8]|uniref:FxDxF family PEP-CTERM protein n=1 Tax=Duganella sp. S19_KUP01_CR8 TaxID=3025502 RepID=UPI002FCDD775